MNMEGKNESLLVKLIKERFGSLSQIQQITIPKILAGENVLVLAPTGYGKTESALLPVLEKILEQKQQNIQKNEAKKEIVDSDDGIVALYITPLRALSRDLKERFDYWCERLNVTHDVRSGDTSTHERTKQRKNPPQILLTTVESLQALLLGKVVRKALSKIKFVIVDELHDILDNKRGIQLSLGLERLNKIASFQRIGLSATLANEKEAADLFFGKRNYSVCQVGRQREMQIEVIEEKISEKRNKEIKELAEKNRTLIFVNTRSGAEELGSALKKEGANVDVHHGSLSKEVRISTEDKFKRGEVKSLICTSSLELGIDVGDVNLAIQVGSPHQVFRLVQRIGRSGHALTKVPHGIVFTNDLDDYLEALAIKTFAENSQIEEKKSERGALDVIAHQLCGLCLDFGRIKLTEAFEILSGSGVLGVDFEKFRLIALQLFSEGIIFYDEVGLDIFIKAKVRGRIYYTEYISTIPKMKRFALKEISSNKIVASLDEEFVVNLETGVSFFARGLPYRVVDITEEEVIAEPSSATEIAIPSWTGEDIPVSFEIAQAVGKMRKIKKIDKKELDNQVENRAGSNNFNSIDFEKTVVMEILDDTIIIHCCFGSKVNDALARLFSNNLSKLIGENIRAVTDPYRILIKLPFPLKEEQLRGAFFKINNIRKNLEEALTNSSLLKFKFLNVGRQFGLLNEDAKISHRLIEAMRYSLVYEETMRSIFFRYFDLEKTQLIIDEIKSGKIKFVIDKRKVPSFFAKIGLDRVSASDSGGAFEPRERIIAAFKENVLSKTLQLKCLSCGTERFLFLGSSPEKISCHKCNQSTLAILTKEGKLKKEDLVFSSGLVRNFGKRALIALSTYGIGPSAADRILKKLHPTEESFYLDIIEQQKLFIKNKKFWSLD